MEFPRGLQLDTSTMTLDEVLEAADYAPTYTEQVAYIEEFFRRWTEGTRKPAAQ